MMMTMMMMIMIMIMMIERSRGLWVVCFFGRGGGLLRYKPHVLDGYFLAEQGIGRSSVLFEIATYVDVHRFDFNRERKITGLCMS